MKVKKSELKSGYKVFYLGERWDVVMRDSKIVFIREGHADVLHPEEIEFEVIHPVEYYCVGCKKSLKTNASYGIEGGIELTGVGGYGSVHDDKTIECIICDECITFMKFADKLSVCSDKGPEDCSRCPHPEGSC